MYILNRPVRLILFNSSCETRLHLQSSTQMGSTVQRDNGTVNVVTSLTHKEHEHTNDILRGTESLSGIGLDEEVASSINNPLCHLGGDEAGSNHVDSDVSGTKLNSESLSKMVDGGLGGQVAVDTALGGVSDTDTGNGAHDDDSGRVGVRSASFQKRSEELDGREDTLDVELQYLRHGGLGVVLNGSSPGRTSVGNENVTDYLAGSVLELLLGETLQQSDHSVVLADISRQSNCLALESLAVQSLARLVTGIALSRRDIDSLGSSMEQTVGTVQSEASGAAGDDSDLVGGSIGVLGEFWEKFLVLGHCCECLCV